RGRGNPPLCGGRQNRGIPGGAILRVVGAALLARGGAQRQRRTAFRGPSLGGHAAAVCALPSRTEPLLSFDLQQRAGPRAAIRLGTHTADSGAQAMYHPGLGPEEDTANYADPRPFSERHPNLLWIA